MIPYLLEKPRCSHGYLHSDPCFQCKREPARPYVSRDCPCCWRAMSKAEAERGACYDCRPECA